MVNSIEISVKGSWAAVPAVQAGEFTLIIDGRWVRIAAVHDEHWLVEEVLDPRPCLRELHAVRQRGLRADIFTFSQKPPTITARFPYHTEWDSVAVAKVDSFEDWWKRVPQETRKNVRRAEKRGVSVEVRNLDDDLITGVMQLNNSVSVRQGRPYTHYGKSFEQVKKDHSSFLDRSEFLGAYAQGRLIGYIKVVYRGRVASLLNLLAMPEHYDKRPMNALIAKAIERCEVRGVSYLTYGLFQYGNKRTSSVQEFKLRNGFEEMLLPRYYIPLTTWGKICLQAGLHRDLIDVLPNPVIKAVVSARASWYTIKNAISRCSSMAEQPKSNRQTECSNPPAGSNILD